MCSLHSFVLCQGTPVFKFRVGAEKKKEGVKMGNRENDEEDYRGQKK